jgi:hypothetical protein
MLVFLAQTWRGPASGPAAMFPIAPVADWLVEPTPTPVEPLLYPAEGESLPLWILLCAFGGIMLLASISWPMFLARLRDNQSDDKNRYH